MNIADIYKSNRAPAVGKPPPLTMATPSPLSVQKGAPAVLPYTKPKVPGIQKYDGVLSKGLKLCTGLSSPRHCWTDDSCTLIRVSQIYDVCERMACYVKDDPPTQVKVKSNWGGQLMMQMGTDLHAYFQDVVLPHMEILWGGWRCDNCTHTWEGFRGGFHCPHCGTPAIYQEMIIIHYVELTIHSDDAPLKGHIDGILDLDRLEKFISNISAGRDPFTGYEEDLVNPAHLEIKTTNPRTYQAMKANPELPSYYTTQANLYQRMADEALIERGYLNFDIKSTLFLYLDRSMFEWISFMYEHNPVIYKKAIDKASLIKLHADAGTFPDRCRECKSFQSKKAKSCYYRDRCFNI
jgi:hypothetical protein